MIVQLISSILIPRSSSPAEICEVDYINSAITAKSPENRRRQADEAESATRADVSVPLTANERRNNTVRDYENVIDTVNFLFSPGWGCLHVRGEYYLVHKTNTRPPPEFLADQTPCVDQCCMSTGEYKKYMLPVNAQGVITFLGSDHFNDCIRGCSPVSVQNADELIGSLSGDRNSDWRLQVFALKTVPVYCIRAFFFQLLGAKMLGFEWSNNTKSINYVLLKSESGIYNYNTMSFWSAFEFRSQRHGAKGRSYSALKDNSVFRSYFKSHK